MEGSTSHPITKEIHSMSHIWWGTHSCLCQGLLSHSGWHISTVIHANAACLAQCHPSSINDDGAQAFLSVDEQCCHYQTVHQLTRAQVSSREANIRKLDEKDTRHPKGWDGKLGLKRESIGLCVIAHHRWAASQQRRLCSLHWRQRQDNRWRTFLCTLEMEDRSTESHGGNDYLHVHLVIHLGNPFEMVEFIQGQGRAGVMLVRYQLEH